MPLRGCISVSDTPDFFSGFVKQPVNPARVDEPAIAAADFRNFLLVELAILRFGYKVNKLITGAQHT